VFWCEFKDDEAAKGKNVNIKPLYEEGFNQFANSKLCCFKFKNYCLEKAYRKDFKFINRYELMIPIE
jgi:hypothetical protein